MKAIEFSGQGGPEVIQVVGGSPVPTPGAGEVLIRVVAAGMNRADLLQRMGRHPPPAGTTGIPGLEVSGYIEATGTGVDPALAGSPVCALLSGGGYAEYALAPAALCLPVGGKLDLVAAAGLPEALYTVTKNLLVLGRLKRGEHLLIHGGASGIGTLGVQVALAMGARVSVTAGSPEKRSFCENLGAIRALDYAANDLESALKEDPVDVVLDMLGGALFPSTLAVMNTGGRMVSIAFMGGREVTLDIETLMKKRLTLMGSMLRHDTLADKKTYNALILEHFWPKILQGTIQPVIAETFPLENARAAHEEFAKRRHIGKILLKVSRQD